MTLNKTKTHLLNAYIAGGIDTEKGIYGLTIISTADYNALVDEIATWEAAYLQNSLNGTNEDNTTFAFDGIDEFPSPPHK